ncbi:MAG: hypothetical protein DRN15_10800 [Thermoprotei archaeon]|nr:MAG: hypothetical protein DRN15_10800 [Thermoprotei archaeon]
MGEKKFVRVTITIPPGLLEELEEMCREHGYTRSEFVRTAIRRFITYLKMSREEIEEEVSGE